MAVFDLTGGAVVHPQPQRVLRRVLDSAARSQGLVVVVPRYFTRHGTQCRLHTANITLLHLL